MTASLLKSLLSILAVFNNAVVWMVSTRPSTSKSSSPFNSLLVTVLNALIMIGIIITFMFHSLFNSLARSRYLYFFSFFFSVLFSGYPVQQSPQFCKFSFFVDYYKVWSSGRDYYFYYYFYYYYYYPTLYLKNIVILEVFMMQWLML